MPTSPSRARGGPDAKPGPLGEDVGQEVHPCAPPVGRGPPPRGLRDGRLGQGPAEKGPGPELEGSGPGQSGMEEAAV